MGDLVVIGERVPWLIRGKIPFRSVPCGCLLTRFPWYGEWTAIADLGVCRFRGFDDLRHQRLIEEFCESAGATR